MARKFIFNLQKYLDYKESIVNGKAADLLKSKKLLDKENNKLEKLFDEKEIATLDFKKNAYNWTVSICRFFVIYRSRAIICKKP